MTDEGTVSPDCEARAGILAIIHDRPDEWIDSLRSLRAGSVQTGLPVYVACVDMQGVKKHLTCDGVHLLDDWALSAASSKIFQDKGHCIDALLVVTAPVAMPANMFDVALAWMASDPRIATVSFLSNAAGPFSFPYRNSATPYPIRGMDENGVTRTLRTLRPDVGPVPVGMPAGSAVLVSHAAWSVLGGFDGDLDPRPKESVAEFALRGSRRGFQHRLDSGTYVTSQWFRGFPDVEPTQDAEARHRLHVRDASFPEVHDHQCSDLLSPLAMALDVARSKVDGLKVLIDADCLGPLEMGTQVQTLAVIRALEARKDVASLGVAVPGCKLPDYAKDLLTSPKIRIYDSNNLMFEGTEYADILHRPFQPDRLIPWDRWRSLAKRVVVTIQDLIAYRIGAYHREGATWLAYRRQIYEAVRNVDVVVAISHDTKASIIEERLCVSPDRIRVISNGSNHLDEQSSESIPPAILEHQLSAAGFILVLGATYAHKNRDLAIRVWQELRRRGSKLALVMAGASVVLGSSRADEAIARRVDDELLITLPDVSGDERTWLLRHAALVMYPTMAEGFGMIPFEAAALGTPTTFVGFGPLGEMLDVDWLPKDWSVNGLADFSERLLLEPELSGRMIDLINARNTEMTWDRTASELVEAYRSALAVPPRS